jgi:predicted metal-dependent hydrolase
MNALHAPKSCMFIENIIYKIHPRARRLTLRIVPGPKVVVTIPRFVSIKIAEKFVRDQEKWIVEQLKTFASSTLTRHTTVEIHRAKIIARKIVLQKLLHFNTQYNFYYASVSIRNQRTRWGSCSRHKQLSFNYRIAFLPEELVDYIVVHELCHLQEMNHSPRFWMLVSQTLPDFRERRYALKKIRLS